jgi:hypothetical protein
MVVGIPGKRKEIRHYQSLSGIMMVKRKLPDNYDQYGSPEYVPNM